MALRPEIFIAAAAPETNACRKAAKLALLEIGARPVEQADFNIEYGPLHGVLMQLLQKCDAVVHIMGYQFGREPAERTLHAPRRSFTHYELDVAQRLGLPIYTFSAAPGTQLVPFGDEDEEARQLQADLRKAYSRSRDDLFHETFTSPEDLGRRIRALRSRLIVRKALAQLPSRPMGARFIGRHRLMEDVRKHLEAGSIHLLQPTHGHAPLGGSGTSTLAVELAWRLHDAGELDYVFWLPAGAGADFEAALAALARTDSLALLPDEVVSHRSRLNAVFDWFQRPVHTGRFLVIVDGVDNETSWWSLKSFLPKFELGSVILTGRPQAWPGMLTHAVAAFSAEQVRDFFISRLGQEKPIPPADLPVLDRIAEVVGRLPLALEMAAGHLRETGQSAREFLLEILHGHDSPSARAELADVFAVIEERLDEGSRQLMLLLICLAPEPAAIPLAIFEGRGDWPITSAALEALENRALVMRDESTRTLRIHRAIRQIARDRLLTGHVDEALNAARSAMDSALHRATDASSASIEMRELLIPHCRALLGQLNGHPLEAYATPLARSLAHWLSDCGRPLEAELFYRRALASGERRHGANHPEVAPRLRDLAGVLRVMRRLKEAEELYRRCVAISEAHGADAGSMIADLQSLANCLRAQDRLADAEELYRRVLEIEERNVGHDHPRVAIALHRLAGVVEAAHRRREAEVLYRRALDIDEATFGVNHPRLAARLYHYALSLVGTRREAEAEDPLRRGLGHEQKKLGQEHADLAPIFSVLATLVEDLGRPIDAERYYRRAHRILESTVGPQHSETALAAANVGAFLHEQGRAEEALAFYHSAAEALYRASGRFRGPHPHLASVLKNYGGALALTGQDEQAIRNRLAQFEILRPRREATRHLLEE